MRKWFIAATLVLAIAFAVTERAAAQLSILGLKNSMVQFVLRQISVPGEFEVLAERVEEPEDGDTSLVGVTIADADGVWLKIGTLTLNWSPGQILQGEIDIRRASAADVEVLRLPTSAPTVKEDAEVAAVDDEPFDWPRSPLTLNVEELLLERVSIAAGVIAEQSLAFDARGAARDAGDEQSARLSIRRTDGVSGRIQLEYFRTFESPVLNVNLDAVETAGGIVAELAGFPADSTSRVQVSAKGPFDAWDLRLNAEVEKIVNITGLVTIDAVNRLSAQASLNVTPGEALDPEIQRALAPQSRLDFEIAEGAEGVVEIENGAIKSPFFGLTASGNYNRNTTDTALNLALSAKPELAELIDGITFDGLDFEGTVKGPTDALDAGGALTLTGVLSEAADLGEARLNTNVQVRGSRIGFAVAGDLAKLRLDRLTPELLGDIGIEAGGAFEDGKLTLDGFTFESTPLLVEASGTADLGAQSADFAYGITTTELAGLANAYGLDAAGMLSAKGSASGPLSAIGLDGQLDLTGLKFDGDTLGELSVAHDVKVGNAVGGSVNVLATGSEYGEAKVESTFNLEGQALTVSALRAALFDVAIEGTASVDLERTAADAELTVDASDLTRLSPIVEMFTGERIAGSASGNIVLDDAADGQALAAKITVSQFTGFDVKLAQARVEADVNDLLGEPSGDVVLAVSNISHPMARVATADVQTTLTDLSGLSNAAVQFEVTGLEVTDAASVGKIGGTADLSDLKGALAVKAEAKASGISAAGAAEVGEVNLVADLANLTATPLGSVKVEASKIAAGGAAMSAVKLDATIDAAGDLEAVLDAPDVRSGDVRVSSARLVAKIRQVLQDNRDLDVTFDAARVAAAPATIDQPKVTVQGTMSELRLGADATGSLQLDEETSHPLALRLRAVADASSPDLAAQISDAWVSLGEAKIGLRSPAKIASSGGTTEIGNLDLAIPGGGLTGSVAAHQVGFGTDLALALTDFDALAATLETFGVDLPLTDGSIDLKLKADTRPGSANGDLNLAARGLKLGAGLNDVGALDLDATGKWNGSSAQVQSSLTGPYGDPVRLAATLPVRAGSDGIPAVPSNGPIDASVKWRGEISRFMALVPAPDHVLSGNLNIDLGIGGTLDKQVYKGSIALEDGQYQNLDTGTILTDLKLGSTVDGDGELDLKVDARDGSNGTVGADIRLGNGKLDAKLTTNGAVLVRRDDVIARVTTDITAAGPLLAPAIKGRVLIDEAEVRLVNATPPSVADLGDVRYTDDPPAEEEEPAGGNILLDIKIEAPGRIYVRGRGLDSEWIVDLDVKGNAAAPIITGTVERRRGRLDFVGRNFELSKGIVRFAGGSVIDPILDVSLEHEKDGFTGRIEVTGNASDPKIGFSSTPQVPEEEVLPRTLFGSSSQSLGAGDAILLVNALAELTGQSGNTAGNLRDATGLDVLRIDETEDGTAEVNVGKNVADGVYVGFNQPVDGSAGKVEIEVDVYQDLQLNAEVGQGNDSSVGVQWRIDF